VRRAASDLTSTRANAVSGTSRGNKAQQPWHGRLGAVTALNEIADTEEEEEEEEKESTSPESRRQFRTVKDSDRSFLLNGELC